MDIKKITVFGGYGKDGSKEKVEKFELKIGDIISIVGTYRLRKNNFNQ